ncbi:hypothetical protein LINPERPRIM_LOCUS43575 [Linum perenne]
MLCGGRESDGTKASLLQDHVPPVTMRRSTVNGITNAPEMATSIQCHNCINPHPTRLPLHRLPVTFRHPIGEFRPRMRRNRFSEWQPVKIGVQFEHIADQLSDLLQATPNELLDMPVRALEPFQARVLVAQGGAEPRLEVPLRAGEIDFGTGLSGSNQVHLRQRPGQLRDREVEELPAILDRQLLPIAKRQCSELRDRVNSGSRFFKRVPNSFIHDRGRGPPPCQRTSASET